mgnify:CR=1 FL=1
MSFSGKSLQKIQMLDRANGDCIRKLEKAILSESDILYFNIDFVARFASHQKIYPADLETRTLNLDFTPYRIYCRKLVNARLLDRFANDAPFEMIHPVRQVQVVRFRRPQRQHGHFVAVLLHVGVVGFGKFPGGHGGASS